MTAQTAERPWFSRFWRFAAAGVVAMAAAIFGLQWVGMADRFDAAAESGLWRTLQRDDRPLVVVLGDYYIFGEVGDYGNIERLIRDFHVNSREELESGYEQLAMDGADYTDMRLSYLPVGAGVALAELSGVVRSIGREMIVIPQSSLDAKTVQSSDILYVGYLSGLGLLKQFVFAASNFELGATFDELIDRDTGRLYVSEAGLPDGPVQDYLDYAFFSTFPGPSGNRILVVAGMRDEGLMEMASILAAREPIDDLAAAVGAADEWHAFEALYRVRGMNRMNIAAERVFAATIDSRHIWIERPGSSVALSGGVGRAAE
jgi:hypothetical protein